MNTQKNARTTPFGRAAMVRRVLEDGWSVAAAASAFEVSTRAQMRTGCYEAVASTRPALSSWRRTPSVLLALGGRRSGL
jgi:transposase-like protein